MIQTAELQEISAFSRVTSFTLQLYQILWTSNGPIASRASPASGKPAKNYYIMIVWLMSCRRTSPILLFFFSIFFLFLVVIVFLYASVLITISCQHFPNRNHAHQVAKKTWPSRKAPDSGANTQGMLAAKRPWWSSCDVPLLSHACDLHIASTGNSTCS